MQAQTVAKWSKTIWKLPNLLEMNFKAALNGEISPGLVTLPGRQLGRTLFWALRRGFGVSEANFSVH